MGLRARMVSVVLATSLTAGVGVATGSPAQAQVPAQMPDLMSAQISAHVSAQTRPQLGAAIARALGSHRSDVGVVVHDRRTGAVFSYNPSLVNCTGSIVKVMVLVATLRKQRAKGTWLTTTQQALARKMIRYSDNTATTSLFRYVGGAPTLTALAKTLGMRSTKGTAAWGRTSTTARDQRILMDALVGGTRALAKTDRAYVLGLMGSVTAGQRWGVGTVPAGVKVQLKNGWVPLTPRAWRVNSIGRVVGKNRDYTIAILSYDNGTMGAGVSRVNTVAKLVYASLATAWG